MKKTKMPAPRRAGTKQAERSAWRLFMLLDGDLEAIGDAIAVLRALAKRRNRRR